MNACGHWRTLPRVIEIDSAYLLGMIETDTGDRYGGSEPLMDFLNGRPLPSRSPVCENIPPDLAAYLARGTDLAADHAEALRLVDCGRSVRGWKAVATLPPLSEIRPSWSMSARDGGRIHTRDPALQSMPKRYRLDALYPARCGDGYGEVDFVCCHGSIALILAGFPRAEDLHTRLAAVTGLPRDTVKAIVNPILRGQTRAQFIYRNGKGELPAFDAVWRELHTLGVLAVPGATRGRLQEIEAAIACAVLSRQCAEGIPAGLPVYDSFVTAYPGRVQAFMREESERILGYPLAVRVTDGSRNLFS